MLKKTRKTSESNIRTEIDEKNIHSDKVEVAKYLAGIISDTIAIEQTRAERLSEK